MRAISKRLRRLINKHQGYILLAVLIIIILK